MASEPPVPAPVVPARLEREMVERPAKLLRIGAMVREMLEEVRRAPLDDQGRRRLREIYERSLRELREILSPDLEQELDEVTVPFGPEVPSSSELRIAQAQLVGWLEGLFHGIQAAVWAQYAAAQGQANQFPRRSSRPSEPAEQGPYL